MSKRPADYTIYKGSAALRFTLKPGEPVEIYPKAGSGRTEPYLATKTGVVFVQIARAKGERRYDWDNKVTLGLNATEISKVILAMEGAKQDFFHDQNMGTSLQGKETKRLAFSGMQDRGTIFCNITATQSGKENKFPSVPISPDEAQTVKELCKAAVSKVLGWA